MYAGVDLRKIIDLKGTWSFSLDVNDDGLNQGFANKSFTEEVILPGTTDTNSKGDKNTNKGGNNILVKVLQICRICMV